MIPCSQPMTKTKLINRFNLQQVLACRLLHTLATIRFLMTYDRSEHFRRITFNRYTLLYYTLSLVFVFDNMLR